MYADLDFWLALLKHDDWLAARAERILDKYDGELTVSLATFIELFLVEDRFNFDRERAITAILELATFPGDPAVVYQASRNVKRGLSPFDAFHAALSEERIVSSDGAYDDLNSVTRVRLDPNNGY